MPATVEIACEDCGIVVQTPRRNTKYCRVCRMVRDLPFVTTKKRSCMLCENKFQPISIRDHCCGEHAPRLSADVEVSCAYCGAVGLSVAGDVAVCRICARTPGEVRLKFFRALVRKQADRQATQYPDPEPMPPWPTPADPALDPAI